MSQIKKSKILIMIGCLVDKISQFYLFLAHINIDFEVKLHADSQIQVILKCWSKDLQ